MLENFQVDQINASKRQSKAIFEYLRPVFISKLWDLINDQRKSNKGPKIKIDFNAFFNGVFELLDNTTKYCTISDHYNIPVSTFARYLKLLKDNLFFEKIYQEFIGNYQIPPLLLTDTSTVCSHHGKEGTGYSYKIKNKKAVKIGIISDTKRVIYAVSVDLANLDDRKNYSQMAPAYFGKPTITLADAGYTGNEFHNEMLNRNNRIIAAPKRLRNGKPSHYLTAYEKLLLKQHRPKVEHLNAQLKNFRGIAVKFVRQIATYRLLLFFAVLLLCILNGVVKKNLTKYPINLKK